jgi:DhnA family fructose-bisphosphate aldolase class Ia
VVNLLLLPGQPELHHQCVANVAALKHTCEQVGMPLMVEPLVMAPNDTAGGYMVDGDLALITALVRQAAELGADIIKADPCTDPADFHHVVETAGTVPVLVRGGGRAPDAEILHRTAQIMDQGAAGIVYGRNIIQHPNPHQMVKALMAIVHHRASADTAAALLATDGHGPDTAAGRDHPARSGAATTLHR